MPTTNAALRARREAAVPRGLASACSAYIERASNAEAWDVEGRRYVDFASGISVLNVGHRHPKVAEAVAAQMERVSHPCVQVTAYEPYVALAERLNALAPGAHPKKTLFLTTGAEAVENAVKIARARTGRPGVIAFTGGFHGRTLLALALTGKVAPYKLGFGPFPGDVHHAPFPMEYHGVTEEQALAGLERIFKSDIEPRRVAAIVIEPVLGEGGFYVAPAAFLRRLREICDAEGIVLVADEIQSGMGRTGRMFAIEHSGVVPDLVTTAKSLGGGLPLSAVTGRAEIMDAPDPGGLGGTYGGNAAACAAGLAVLDVIREERLLERAAAIGERIAGRFRAMSGRDAFSCIGEVRGIGAMQAIELVADRATRAPAADLARALCARAEANGLLLLSCGLYGNVIRVLVPLTASDAIVDEGLEILERSLGEATGGS